MAEEITAPLGLAPGQIAYGGLVLGAGTAWRWRQLDGWEDMPALDSGDVARPSRHGAWPGRDLAQPRVITLTGMILARREEVRHRLAELRSATAVAESAELRPLVVNALGRELLAYARPTQRVVSLARGARLGHIPFTVQWTAPDPRRFSPTLHSRTITAPTESGDGLDYPLEYPLDYGLTAAGGSARVTNLGDTPTHPVLTISGPCDRPRITGGGLVMEYDLTLADGEVLVIDCHAGTVLLGGTADRFYTRTSASVPVEAWTLAPGTTVVQFRPLWAGPGATVLVQWRDAYL